MNTVHGLVENWVKIHPDRCAVRDATTGREVTFQQLWCRAGGVATSLSAAGVHAGEVVALALPRSIDLVVGMLGVLRAGGAYLALEVTAPPARTALMLEDAGVRLVIDDWTPAHPPVPLPSTVTRLPVTARPLAVAADRGPHADEDRSDDGEAAAYVAFTSGSTGRPKGVAVPHRAVVRLVSHAAYCPISPTDRVAHVSNPAFDATTFEVWSALTAGATVTVLPSVSEVGLHDWVELLQAEQITTMFLTTSLFHMVARERPSAFASVQTLLVGGEQLDTAAARRVLSADAPTRLVNAYGPTESTTFATTFDCTLESLPAGSRAPIGFPLQQTRIHVLGDDLCPVRPGEIGELCLAGPGVALGYLGRPELTAARFVPEPTVGAQPPTTMYRTGDRVRQRPDGALELLGRVDRQVKLRGFRIELEEIEAAAVATGLVEAAFVEKVGDGPDARLDGYLLPAPSATDDLAGQVTAALADRLPTYMHPTRWQVLADLPVGPTGKTDRDALAEHVAAPSDRSDPTLTTRASRAPQDSVAVIALAALPAATATTAEVDPDLDSIWRDILAVADPPRSGHEAASFLALGGNSILAVQLVARAREQLGVILTPGQVLRAASLDDLCAAVTEPATPVPADPVAPRGAPDAGSAPDPLLPGPADAAPLSVAQQRLAFLQELDPDSTGYNVPVVIRLRGRLSTQALQQAFTLVVERHTALRSHLVRVGEQSMLVPAGHQPVPLRLHPVGSEDAAVGQLLEALTGAPFDLTTGPLLRADLLRLAPEHHLLAVTFHHLVVDGWSVAIFLRELAAGYAAYAAGGVPVLPRLPIQPADGAGQPDPVEHGRRHEQVTFWQQQLRGVPPLALPADGPAQPATGRPGPGHAFRLPDEMTQRLRQVSADCGTTPFALLLAAFQVLVGRLAGQQDFAVAVPMAGRTRSETMDLIGMFVQTVALRADLSGNPRFVDHLEATQAALHDGLAHQEAPFERVVAGLHLDRHAGRLPVAQVIFGARDPLPDVDLGGLTLERVEWGQSSAGFDLAVEIEVSESDIRGRLEVAPGLLTPASARLLLNRYQTLLAAVADDPRTRITDLPLDDSDTARRALEDGTGPTRPRPARPLHELVRDRVADTPTAIAVHGPDRSLSFAELDGWAAEIADGLRADGVTPGAVVAVVLPRTARLVATLLAVLRVGAAYLPVDLGQPIDRLTGMIADADARLVLTDQPGAARLAGLAVPVALVGDPADAPRAHPCRTGGETVEPGSVEQLAYVTFTSGSTGRPKAVAVPHRAVVNHAHAAVEAFGLTPGDRVLQFASAGFDVFAEEVYPTLLAGARIVIPGAANPSLLSPAEVEETVRSTGVTVVNLPSSFWSQWAKEILAEDRQLPRSLRLVVIGSEQADGRLLADWQRHTGIRVLNLYGVSEATISSTVHRPARNGSTRSATVPIGRPIDNTQALVLDPRLRPVPVGVDGELHLGGAGLAHGYLGRPDLTAERFVPNPYGAPGSRLYRTGDLARWIDTGDSQHRSLDHRGRIDQQIKIRGVRIEPGEIESQLSDHPAVTRAAVAVHPDATGLDQLVAYLVCAGPPVALAELRRFLRDRLPSGMLPTILMPLDRLPQTASGKIDRTALPVPVATPDRVGAGHRPPTTPTEHTLTGIWGELLGAATIGIDDDFFDLGGHSLLATQLVARIRQRLDRSVPLRAVFDHPTIADLADHLDATSTIADPAHPTLPRIRRVARDSYRIAAHLDPRSSHEHDSQGHDHVA